MDKKQRGRWGENSAVDFLVKKGYNIVGRNYISRNGEIDIIAEDGKRIVFIEVKVLQSYEEAELDRIIGPKKRDRVRRTALDFLAKNGISEEREMRCDVVAVMSARRKILHYENAF